MKFTIKKSSIKACFYYKRAMEYSLFLLFIFLLRLDFERGKINKTKKECSIPRLVWKQALKPFLTLKKTIYVHAHTCETVMFIHVSHMFIKKCESCCLLAADFTQIKISHLFEKNIFNYRK